MVMDLLKLVGPRLLFMLIVIGRTEPHWVPAGIVYGSCAIVWLPFASEAKFADPPPTSWNVTFVAVWPVVLSKGTFIVIVSPGSGNPLLLPPASLIVIGAVCVRF